MGLRMSTYFLHKVAQLVRKDPEFRERIKRDPAAAIAGFRLSDEERRALLAGDVGRLAELGVHGYLLHHLATHEICGLNKQNYLERIHQPGRV